MMSGQLLKVSVHTSGWRLRGCCAASGCRQSRAAGDALQRAMIARIAPICTSGHHQAHHPLVRKPPASRSKACSWWGVATLDVSSSSSHCPFDEKDIRIVLLRPHQESAVATAYAEVQGVLCGDSGMLRELLSGLSPVQRVGVDIQGWVLAAHAGHLGNGCNVLSNHRS